MIQTTPAENTVDRSIKPRSFGHMHASFLHQIELHSIREQEKTSTRKKLAQESITHAQETYTFALFNAISIW